MNKTTQKDHTIASRIWIKGDNGTFLGEGRVRLLEEIGRTGSISASAKAMKMSYKKAWELVDSMNSQAYTPLVVRVSGGRNGGGTELTKEAERVIKAFHRIKSDCEELLREKMKEYAL